MDEVDGKSGGDMGGVSDLIASIKIRKIPIICICNDRYNKKLKILVNYCLPLNFRKPTKQQVIKFLVKFSAFFKMISSIAFLSYNLSLHIFMKSMAGSEEEPRKISLIFCHTMLELWRNLGRTTSWTYSTR